VSKRTPLKSLSTTYLYMLSSTTHKVWASDVTKFSIYIYGNQVHITLLYVKWRLLCEAK